MNGYKLKKGQTLKIKWRLTKHAKQRLKERFDLDVMPTMRANTITLLNTLGGNKIAFQINGTNMVVLKNKSSAYIVTVMTREMWDRRHLVKKGQLIVSELTEKPKKITWFDWLIEAFNLRKDWEKFKEWLKTH